MNRWFLTMFLVLGQLIGWSGRCHYLCFAADGRLNGIDGGPHACFFNNHSHEDASFRGAEETLPIDGHVLLAVDPLSSHARLLVVDVPTWTPALGMIDWVGCGSIVDTGRTIELTSTLFPRYSLLARITSVRQC
jgi:hypothetical protein